MNLREKVEELYSKINLAQRKNGLNHQVEIVGVTKTRPFLYIQDSYVAGLRHIGENRIQEAESKFESFKNAAYKKQSNFLLATSAESCSLSEPEAVFLGLANIGKPSACLCSLSLLKAGVGKITSPLTSIF